MSNSVIHLEGLGKRYRISGRERHFALRNVLAGVLTAPFRRRQRSATDYLWALRDVSLDVQQGEVVGLIGRNGAGKTTLLKLLSRITRPTAGFAEIHGRVGSLLAMYSGNVRDHAASEHTKDEWAGFLNIPEEFSVIRSSNGRL